MKLLQELGRRNVIRVAGLYLVVAWLAVQVAGTVLPMFESPPWIARAIVIALAIGFLPALALAWAFEWTPQGLKRDGEVAPDPHATANRRRRVDRFIVLALAVTLMFVLAERWWPAPTATGSPTTVAAPATASIAVLPFANLSEDKQNEHFGDGLAEDLLDLLAKTPGLRVAARTSSFHFKGKSATVPEIAKALDVDTVLEGSVRRAGDTVRVVVQLISARDGSHLWSGKYDRKLEDLFVVQDEIAGSIVESLLPRLGIESAPKSTRSIDPIVYERFLRARNSFYSASLKVHQRIKDEFAAVAREAPEFAPAYGWLARSWLNVDESTGGPVPISESHPAAQAAIDRALALDPREASAFHALGLLRSYQNRRDEALAAYAKSAQLSPAMVDSRLNRSALLEGMGRAAEARAEVDEALRIDPLHPRVLLAKVRVLAGERRWRAAFIALEHALPAVPLMAEATEAQVLYVERHLPARAIHLLESISGNDPDEADTWLLEPLNFAYQQLGLHEAPLLVHSPWRAVSLAVLGRQDEAERALAEVRLRPGSGLLAANVEAITRMAQGQFAEAEAVLIGHQKELDEAAAGSLDAALTLAILAVRRGDAVLAERMLEYLEAARASGRFDPGTNAAIADALVALLRGRIDDAVSRFEKVVSDGYVGDGTLGGTTAADWLFEREPRFAPILQRMRANRDAQLAELERLRKSHMTPAQARAEYVATLPPDPP